MVYSRRLNGSLLALAIAFDLLCAAILWVLGLYDHSKFIFFFATVVPLILVTQLKATTTLSDSSVSIALKLMSSEEISYSRITDVRVGPRTGAVQGAGVHLIDGAFAYLVGGRTLEIHTLAGSYLVSVKDPERVAATLLERVTDYQKDHAHRATEKPVTAYRKSGF